MGFNRFHIINYYRKSNVLPATDGHSSCNNLNVSNLLCMYVKFLILNNLFDKIRLYIHL